MEKNTNEEVMERLYTFQEIFGKIEEFGWWDLDRIQTDTEFWFTSKEFQEGLSVCGVHLTLAAPYQ